MDRDVEGGAGDGVVLLVGSGMQTYREYLLQGLARQSALWLVGEEQPTWQFPYIVGYSVVGALDTDRPVFDQRGLVDAARTVAAEWKVAGVITYDELLVTSAAKIAESLGVRGLTVAGAENCRDKARTRAALTAAGLPQPRYALVRSLESAAQAAGEIGYPVVAKPRGMGASVGVMRAERAADLEGAFAVTERARRLGPPVYEDGVLIEECVEGPEISVDGVVADGEYRPFCLARKQLGPPPCFEEVGHLVDAADPLLADEELRAVLDGAHRVLGVLDGITHTEVKLTSRGPVVIEVNARLGGDLIPYLGKLATGVDPGQVAAQAATGAAPSVEPTASGCAGVRFLYPPEDCRVVSVTLPDPSDVPGLLDAHPIAKPGDIVRIPPNAHLGRYAFFVATADTPEACQAILDEAAARTGLDYEPLAQEAAFEGRPW